MKTVHFNLRLTFSDNVKIEHLKEIMDNVAEGIVGEARNGMGIAPDGSDYHTETVELTHINVTYPVKKSIY